MSSVSLLFILLVLALIVIWLILRGPKKNTRKTPARPPSKRTAPSQEQQKLKPGEFKVGGAEETLTQPKPVPEELAALKLRMADNLELKEQQTLKRLVEAMPPPHPIQLRLAGGLDTPEELKDTVASDAGLTASVLKTVNSAAFSLSAPITSVQHAITYLGVTVVKGLVMQAALSERATKVSPAQQVRLDKIWKAARCSSAIAQLIGQELAIPSLSVVTTNALLSCLGDITLVSFNDGELLPLTEGSTLFERVEAQQTAIGVNTFVVGSALAQHWGLPASLASGIETASLPLSVPLAESPIQGDALDQIVIIYLAGLISDAITHEGLTDIADFQLEDRSRIERFYLADYVRSGRLARLPSLFEEPGFKRKINRTILTLS